MPISKQEALSSSNQLDAIILEGIYKAIDEALKNGRRVFSGKLIPWRLTHVITEAYERVGWKVRYTSDQREGDYYTFS